MPLCPCDTYCNQRSLPDVHGGGASLPVSFDCLNALHDVCFRLITGENVVSIDRA